MKKTKETLGHTNKKKYQLSFFSSSSGPFDTMFFFITSYHSRFSKLWHRGAFPSKLPFPSFSKYSLPLITIGTLFTLHHFPLKKWENLFSFFFLRQTFRARARWKKRRDDRQNKTLRSPISAHVSNAVKH